MAMVMTSTALEQRIERGEAFGVVRIGEFGGAFVVWIVDADKSDARVFGVLARMDAPEGARAEHACAKLAHSTVTDFARLRGWSTSVPLCTAVR